MKMIFSMIKLLAASCSLLAVTPMTTAAVEGMPQRLIRSTIDFMAASPVIVKPQSMNTVTATAVTSDTSSITMHHPVIAAVVDRWRSQSKIGNRCAHDHMKIALCIEGGGMRGCVAAGSAAAINFLGLNDAIDVVYGSSVGSMIGCYFVSRQYSGHMIYRGKIQITDDYITCTVPLPYMDQPFSINYSLLIAHLCIFLPSMDA